MKKLTLIRHPESDANISHTIGNIWVGLSDYWKESAYQRAQYYNSHFDNSILISNTQHRCKELADILIIYNKLLGIDFHPWLNERNFWMFTGWTKQDMISTLSWLYPHKAMHIGDDFSTWMDQHLYDNHDIPLFESNTVLRNRLQLVLDELMMKYFDQHVVIISSTGVLRNLQAILLSKTTQEFDNYLIETTGKNKIPNLSITEFERSGNTKNLKKFNEIITF